MGSDNLLKSVYAPHAAYSDSYWSHMQVQLLLLPVVVAQTWFSGYSKALALYLRCSTIVVGLDLHDSASLDLE